MFRFNIYTLHQRGITLRKKSESSYLVNLVKAQKVENSFEKTQVNRPGKFSKNTRLKIMVSQVSSPGREEGRTFHYQPASRRSLAQVDYDDGV